jgi:hypothetical protein
MKRKTNKKRRLLMILTGGAIPALLVMSRVFGLPDRFTIPLVIFIGLIFGSISLWSYANRQATGSEWWQDDSASGWRGY